MASLEEVREWLGSVSAEGIGRLDLMRFVDQARVREWRWPGAANDALDLDERAKEILRTAERDGLARHQREVTYVLVAYRRDDDGGTQFAELTVSVPGRSSRSGRPGPGEEEHPANLVGMLQQSMKHNADLHRLLLASHEGRTASLERQLAYLTERVEAADKRHMTVLQLAEAMASAKLEREMQEQQLRLEEQKHRWLSEKLDRFVPIVINRALGGGPGTGKLFMGEELIRQLFGSMDGPRVEALLKGEPISLTTDEAMLVAEIYTTYGTAEKAHEAMRARTLNGAGSANGAATEAAGKEKPS
jgi:hypothetical protein